MNLSEQDLLEFSREKLAQINEPKVASLVSVVWNPRMRSSAGRAKLQLYLIEINPKLEKFGASEVWTTVLHELAHLVAWHRHAHRGHGKPWREACIDLGIPNESVTHALPLPTRKQRKFWKYTCLHCAISFERTRRAKVRSACAKCCKKYNNGKYSNKFLLQEFRLVNDTK